MRQRGMSFAIGLGVLISTPALGADRGCPISGSYVLDESQGDVAFQAIDQAVASVPIASRAITRMRLRKSIAVIKIRVSRAEDRFSIAYDAKTPIVTWIGDNSIRWKLAEGFVYDVSAKASGDAITLTFQADDSERTTSYWCVGQQLVEQTSIVIPLLSAPIDYKRVYDRVN